MKTNNTVLVPCIHIALPLSFGIMVGGLTGEVGNTLAFHL